MTSSNLGSWFVNVYDPSRKSRDIFPRNLSYCNYPPILAPWGSPTSLARPVSAIPRDLVMNIKFPLFDNDNDIPMVTE